MSLYGQRPLREVVLCWKNVVLIRSIGDRDTYYLEAGVRIATSIMRKGDSFNVVRRAVVGVRLVGVRAASGRTARLEAGRFPRLRLNALHPRPADVRLPGEPRPLGSDAPRLPPPSRPLSAVEVPDHRVPVEREFLVAAQRDLANPRRRGIRDRAGVALLACVCRSDHRVRVPTSVLQVLPAPDADFGTVAGEWGATRQELARFLAILLLADSTRASSGMPWLAG